MGVVRNCNSVDSRTRSVAS